MRRLERPSLSAPTLAKLAELQTRLRAAPTPREHVKTLWQGKPSRAFAEIRQTLFEMAPSRSRCMYCEDSMGTDIDHFWPKADYPQGAFCWHNYLLACSHCNSNEKREQFPRDERGNPLLIDPTTEEPSDHLLFLPSTGEFRSLDAKGEHTISVFGLNDDAPPRRLPTGRKDALINFIALLELERYDQQTAQQDPDAARTRECACRHPFSSPRSGSWPSPRSRAPSMCSVRESSS